MPSFSYIVNLFKEWPEYSGCSHFPVKHDSMSVKDAFFISQGYGTLWTGTYGAARKRLLDFMITRVQDDIAKPQDNDMQPKPVLISNVVNGVILRCGASIEVWKDGESLVLYLYCPVYVTKRMRLPTGFNANEYTAREALNHQITETHLRRNHSLLYQS